MRDWCINSNNKIYIINPYSVLTPPGGFLYFPKIPNEINILLLTDCKTNKIFY
jgi:hypothetical protein